MKPFTIELIFKAPIVKKTFLKKTICDCDGKVMILMLQIHFVCIHVECCFMME